MGVAITPNQTSSRMGKYALYFSSLPGILAEERQKFFERNPVEKVHLPAPYQTETLPFAGPIEGESDIKKLQDIVQQAQNILYAAKAVFPFDLFPDTITIDRQKLTVVHHPFFSAKQTVSVPHSNITNIQADIGPIFGSLIVTSEHFINNTQTIQFLPKKDALAIQQLVQGFITVSKEESIDTSKIDDKTLVKMLNELGRGEVGERPIVQE